MVREETEVISKFGEDYSILASVVGALVYDYDLISGKLYWSGDVKTITGFSREDFCKTIYQWERSIHPDDRDLASRELDSCRKEKKRYFVNYRLKIKSGKYIFVEDSGKFIYGSDGKAYRMIGVMRDITEEKKIEGEILESRNKFMKLSENVPGLIFQFTRRRDGRYVVPIASKGIKEIFGCSPKDVVDDFSPISKVIFPEDYDRVIKAIEYSAKHLTFFTCEFRVKIGENPVQWIYSNSLPEKLQDGSITWYGYNYDITEKKKAEEELTLKESKYRALIDLAVDGLLTGDSEGYITDANKSMCVILGMKKEDVIGKYVADLPFTKESLKQHPFRFDLLKKGIIVTTDREIVRSNGSKVIVEMHSKMMPDGTYQSLYIDITKKKKAEEELKKSEARFHSYFSLPLNGVAITSPEKGWIDANDKVKSILGYSLNELKKLTWAEITYPEDLSADEKQFNRLLTGKIENYNLDKRFIRKNKKIVWTNISVGCVRKMDGKVDYIVVSIQDIDEKKKAEEELKQSKENVEKQVQERTAELNKQRAFLSSVLENVPNMIFVKDAKDLKFELFNKAGEDLLGYKREQMIGKSDHDFFPKDQAEFFIKKDRGVLRGGKLFDIPEEPIDTKHGKRYLHTKKIPIYEGGRAKYLMGISEDITEKKRTEIEYRSILKIMLNGFAVMDINGKFLEVNDSYCKMLGYTNEEMLKFDLNSVDIVHNFSQIEEHIKEIVVMGAGKFEAKHKCKDGKILDVEINAAYLESSKKLFAFIHDITERKMSERQLLSKASELERFNRVAVGRELKMIELKKKIAKLEGEQKNKS